MASIMKRGNGNENLPTPQSLSGIVDRIFQDNISRFFNDEYWGFPGVQHGTNIPANLKETDKSYELELVAPGLKKEDFTLNVSDDMLTVSFEHKQEDSSGDKDKGWLRKEYRMQSFSRSFHLDDTIDANKIVAQYSDGILRLSLPKKEGAQKISRTIEIK